jgi:hypothetical protein
MWGGITPIMSRYTTESPMITDTTIDAQIRHSIRKEIMGMDLRVLQRIVYEVRCEEQCIHPDNWQLFPIED